MNMVSIFIVLGAYGAIGFWLYGLRLRRGDEPPGRAALWLLYGLSRAVPVGMLVQRPAMLWVGLLADLLVVLALGWLAGQKTEYAHAGAVYLLNPVVIFAVISGRLLLMAAVWLAGGVLLLLTKKAMAIMVERESGALYPMYAALSGFSFCGIAAAELFNQSLSWLTDRSGRVPAVLLLCVWGAVLSGLWAHRRVFRGRMSPVVSTAARQVEGKTPEYTPLSWRDGAWMLGLTALFALVVFRQLGSTAVPQTALTLIKSEEPAVVLDLGQEMWVERIDLYLGHQQRHRLNLSWQQPETGKRTMPGVLVDTSAPCNWVQTDVRQTLRYFYIDTLEPSAQILEVVLLDGDGNIIQPVNARDYSALFDEQELYQMYPTYYDRMMFDEGFHAETAWDYLNGQPASEITHPPLGKILIAIGIWLFGMVPFGWRFMSAVFGVLMVPLMYLFARKLTGSRTAAGATAVLLGSEFMNFALARIATLDIFAAFFIMLMFYLMFCFVDGTQRGMPLGRRCVLLVFCGMATACAVSVKFTGCYAAVGIAVAFFMCQIPEWSKMGCRKHVRTEAVVLGGVCVVSFLLIPAVVYVLSYTPFRQPGQPDGLVRTAFENTKYMISFHARESFQHAAASPWYSWLLDLRPIIDAHNVTENGMVSTVATFGNPLVVWGGLGALVHNFYLWLVRKDTTARYLTLAYLTMLMPWWFIRRTVFIYQYYVCILILILMLVYSLSRISRYGRRLTVAAAAVSCVLFLLFYPVISGQQAAPDYIRNTLQWLSGWRFA